MQIDNRLASQIVRVAHGYLDQSREYWDCVSFVRQILREVNIELPKIVRALPPPAEFQLDPENLIVGHSIFFRRMATTSGRPWTHCAIVMPENAVIHYPVREGKVVSTPFSEILQQYEIARSHPA